MEASQHIVDLAIIASERQRPEVVDDFATEAERRARAELERIFAQADGLGQGAAVREAAQNRAQRILTSRPQTPWLRHFPDPVRVRSDMIEQLGRGESQSALLGGQVGRLEALDNLIVAKLREDGVREEPPDVTRLRRLYQMHGRDLFERGMAATSGWCLHIWGRCERTRFEQWIELGRHASDSVGLLKHLYFYDTELEHLVNGLARPIDSSRYSHRTAESYLNRIVNMIVTPVGIGLGLLSLIYLGWLFWKPRKEPKRSTYGTADFAAQRDKLPAGQTLYQGVFLGGSSYPGGKGIGAPIVTTPETHTLIVARTRTGKGTRVIIPTLALYTSSIFVIDPKGENAAITARFRRDAFKQTVHIINPWGQLAELFESYGFETATLNPLDVLKADDPNVVATARAIAETICGGISGKEQIWQASATALLTGLLLWVTDQPGETKTLDHVADLLTGGEDVSDIRSTLLPRMAASSSFRGAMRKQVSQFIRMAENTWTGVVFQLSQSLQFASDPRIHEATETSSFRLSEIVNGQTTIYIIIPDEQMQPQSVWLRLVISAITQTYKREKPAAHGIRGMFLIDEFPQMGRFESMVKDIAIMGGTGLDYALVVQSLSQIRELYDKGADTIIGNCSWRWFCNVGDLDTAQHVSTSLGPMTVQTVTQTVNDGDRVGGGHTYGETGRSLLFPDEIMALGRDIAMAFNPTERPHYLHPQDYWELPGYLNHFAGKSGLNFDYLNALDPNPYRPQERSQGRRGGTNPPPPSGAMTRERALKLLALKEGATEAEIKAAYKRMMGKVHPDVGGNDEFAQTLNQARDVLLT